MSSTLKSDVAALVKSLPTVKEVVLAKQGLRALRDEMLYKHPDQPINLADTARLESLGITPLLLAWLQGAGKEALEDLKSSDPEALLAALDTEVAKVEQLQLSIAYPASEEDLVHYHEWFVYVLGRPVLLDVKVDPAIIGGLTLMYKDHFFDYSVQSKIAGMQETLLQRYQQLSQMPADQLRPPSIPVVPNKVTVH